VSADSGIQVAAAQDVATIMDRLEEHGIVLVPGYLDAATIEQAAREAGKLFHQTPEWAHHEEYSVGQSVRMERCDIDPAAFPVMSSVFARPELEKIVGGFFGENYIFSRTIYAILDIVGSTTRVQELHYDKLRHLMSFIYVTDVTAACGPFHCVPGSHLMTREIERENRERHIVPSDDDARELDPGLAGQAVQVLGEAGTLILFDSDIMHHAGIVEEGERLAIRSLSFGAYRAETWYRKDGTIARPA
jgi:hypothetical protein